jgi:hypothetical protein
VNRFIERYRIEERRNVRSREVLREFDVEEEEREEEEWDTHEGFYRQKGSSISGTLEDM